jgi:GT2 family glycosyltransferase
VDNASGDGTVDLVRKNFPTVTLIENGENNGFGSAVNAGATHATGDYLLILNPDTVLDRRALSELSAFLDHRPQAAVCGPKIMYPNGKFEFSARRGFPTPMNSLARIFGLDRLFPRSQLLGSYQKRGLSPDLEVMTDVLSGACILVRREVFQAVGGFDPEYFLFGEDIDLCWKLKHTGHEIWYVPSAQIQHVKGASMSYANSRARKEFYRAMKTFIDKRLKSQYSPVSLSLMKTAVSVCEFCSRRYRSEARARG